ncbi:MAG: DUF3300 domain-containing protein, partial [Usitatibacteraceae bacterium]
MQVRTKLILTGCIAVSLLGGVPLALAQDSLRVQQEQRAIDFTQQELDQMLAPIALYPDGLLTQILMASTYPLEVVQAARWSRSNPGYVGDQAVRAVETQNWDPSVKSLVAFPQVLTLMDSSLDWTERLGNAFLSQQEQVWDTVQNLRQRANDAGNLQSNEQVRVEQNGPIYVIEPSRQDIIYVPYYDPLIVYGDWWWPGYAPFRWAPWPGYYARGGIGRGYYWGSGISIGYGFFFGGVDWRQRHVNVVNRNSFYYRNVNRRPAPGNGWQHDPDHRRGVPYRNPTLRQQFNPQNAPLSPDTRRDYRGRIPGNNGRTDQGDPGRVRPPVQAVPNAPRPTYAPGTDRPSYVPNQQGNTGRSRVVEQRPHALEGVGNAQNTRDASTRGQASLPRPPIATSPRPPVMSAPQPPR